MYVTTLKVISIMAFCTFSIAVFESFLEDIHVLLHYELTNYQRQFINKSTQCVYETTFIALPCHKFMSTSNSIVSIDQALKNLK